MTNTTMNSDAFIGFANTLAKLGLWHYIKSASRKPHPVNYMAPRVVAGYATLWLSK